MKIRFQVERKGKLQHEAQQTRESAVAHEWPLGLRVMEEFTIKIFLSSCIQKFRLKSLKVVQENVPTAEKFKSCRDWKIAFLNIWGLIICIFIWLVAELFRFRKRFGSCQFILYCSLCPFHRFLFECYFLFVKNLFEFPHIRRFMLRFLLSWSTRNLM